MSGNETCSEIWGNLTVFIMFTEKFRLTCRQHEDGQWEAGVKVKIEVGETSFKCILYPSVS